MPGSRPPRPPAGPSPRQPFLPIWCGAATPPDPPAASALARPAQHTAAAEAHLIAGRDQVTELLVAQPLEQEDAAQIIDEHQPPAPFPSPLVRSRLPNRRRSVQQ